MDVAVDRVGDWILEGPAADAIEGWPRIGRHHAIQEITARVWVAPIDDAAAPTFLREARAAQRVLHPNLAKVVGFGHEAAAGLGWVAEEPAPGRAPEGPVPTARALAWAEGLADGLATAHALGAFHEDLVAAVVRVEGDVARVIGLGAAALWRASDNADSAAGAAGDVFALGRLLATWIGSDGPASGKVPADLQALLAEVCAPEPGDRLDAALSFRDRLRALGPAARWTPRAPAASGDPTWGGDPTGDTWSGVVPDATTPTWTGEALVPPDPVASPARSARTSGLDPPTSPTVPPPIPGPRRVPPLTVNRLGLLVIGLLAGLLLTGVALGLGAAWMAATVPAVTIPPFQPGGSPPEPKPVPAADPPVEREPAAASPADAGAGAGEAPPAPDSGPDLSREPAFRQAMDRLTEAARQCARRNKGAYDQVLDVRLRVEAGVVADVTVGALAMPPAGRSCVVNAAKNLTFPTTMSGAGRADVLWGDARR